jgi:hypothetical protein
MAKQTIHAVYPTEGNDTVLLELDRPRELRLTHKVLKRFFALTGCTMSRIDEVVDRYDQMTTLIYVMLSEDAARHGETLTVEDCDDLLEDVSINVLLEKCGEAIAAAFDDGTTEAKAEGADPPAAAGTGAKA